MDPTNAKMVALLMRLAVGEGMQPTVVEGVDLMRTNQPMPLTPVLYAPSIVVVAQGRKIGHVGGRTYCYDPGQLFGADHACQTARRSVSLSA